MKTRCLLLTCAVGSLGLISSFAEPTITVEHRPATEADARFGFQKIPRPVRNDLASRALFSLVDGHADANGGGLSRLHDGQLSVSEDQPAQNFFFRAGTDGGRVRIDLGTNVSVREVTTYSWHTGSRAPQVYVLYGSTGEDPNFEQAPKRPLDPAINGWRLLARVDTRPVSGPAGGQYGVSLKDSSGSLGSFRYLLWDVSATEQSDAFGNTFYSEIDVRGDEQPEEITPVATAERITRTFKAADGRYQFTVDTTVAPDLTEWADEKLRPVVQEWYPRLVALLPSEGFLPRTNVTLRFRDDMGGTPASAGGGNINCNAAWFRKELKREALGSVVHEMVHVVQDYRRVRRDAAEAQRMPGWLVEGIPDYIRWYLYEPQTRGAEIAARNVARARYDASYRVTGNFLDWATRTYDTNLVQKLNAAGRSGQYRDDLWKEWTGKTVQDLGAEWKKQLEERSAALEAGKAK